MSTPDFDAAAADTTYAGHEVLDENNQRVGKVTDVIYDERSPDPSSPTWMVVDPGLLRGSHYVPVDGSYRTVEGAIVVPWNKEWIKSATKADGAHILTDEQREELIAHYATSA